MAEVLLVAIIIVLVLVAAFFLIGAAGIISVEKDSPEDNKDCICTQTKFAVYADINCPVHGERQ